MILIAVAGCDQFSLYDVDKPAAPATSLNYSDNKVVILAIDGLRYSEGLGDSTHQYVSAMWNELHPAGTIYSNFRNEGPTLTMPGHAAILTGTWQSIANDGSERPGAPTLFEYYRFATGAPQQDAWIVGGKSKLSALSYSNDVSYGSSYGASVDVGHASDGETRDQLISVLQTHKPHLVLASLSYVDLKGHSAVWNDYLNQITIADTLTAAIWQYLQSDPYYAGTTYLFITSDHGRHDDAHGGFSNHGDTCEGCEHITFVGLGPDILQGTTLGAGIVRTQRDLCATVGDILGIATPLSDGSAMSEMFQPVTTGIRNEPLSP